MGQGGGGVLNLLATGVLCGIDHYGFASFGPFAVLSILPLSTKHIDYQPKWTEPLLLRVFSGWPMALPTFKRTAWWELLFCHERKRGAPYEVKMRPSMLEMSSRQLSPPINVVYIMLLLMFVPLSPPMQMS